MEKLSRVKKYAQLREELMNDAEPQVTTSDLSQFAERLNRIDSTQFDKIEKLEDESHDPIHIRREAYFAEPEKEDTIKKQETTSMSFNNEYLDEYINEVKQYNKERGFLNSDNTTNNILKDLKKEIDFKEIQSLSELNTEPSYEETTEIPAFGKINDASTISMEVQNLVNLEPVKEIKAEPVQIKGSEKTEKPLTFIPSMDEEMEIPTMVSRKQDYIHQEELEKEKQLREKLMNETIQMRAQLDDYGKELDEVNETMNTGNRILNVVLVILILAMLAVVGVLVYWILLDRGLI